MLRAWLKRNPPGKAARNERRKAATTFNALSVAFAITVVLQPILNGRSDPLLTLAAALAVFVFQVLIHYILDGIED